MLNSSEHEILNAHKYKNIKQNNEDQDQYAYLQSTLGPEIIKLFFMLNSAEHEILNAHKYKSFKKLSIFQAHISLVCYFPCP